MARSSTHLGPTHTKEAHPFQAAKPRAIGSTDQHARHLRKERVALVANERWIWISMALIACIAVVGCVIGVIGYQRELESSQAFERLVVRNRLIVNETGDAITHLAHGRALVNTQGNLPLQTLVRFTNPMATVPTVVATLVSTSGTEVADYTLTIATPTTQGFTMLLNSRDSSTTVGPNN